MFHLRKGVVQSEVKRKNKTKHKKRIERLIKMILKVIIVMIIITTMKVRNNSKLGHEEKKAKRTVVVLKSQ